MLFSDIIIGPIKSRRLGRSLGVNLLHQTAKICSFDCIYCECGLNFRADSHQPSRDEVQRAVEQKMIAEQINNEIKELVTYLPQEQRKVLEMRIYDDVSFKDIAELTNVSINTALGRMRYALINLRKMIKEKNVIVC